MKEEFRSEIGIYFEPIKNENPTHQNLWNTKKGVLGGSSIALNAYI